MYDQDLKIRKLEEELHKLENTQILELNRKKFWNSIKLIARSAILLSLVMGICDVAPRINMVVAGFATLVIMWIDYELHFVKK